MSNPIDTVFNAGKIGMILSIILVLLVVYISIFNPIKRSKTFETKTKPTIILKLEDNGQGHIDTTWIYKFK